MGIERAMTQKEVAAALGVDRKTVRAWTKNGSLPVWFRTDSGRAVYSSLTIEAAQRRAGELHAEKRVS